MEFSNRTNTTPIPMTSSTGTLLSSLPPTQTLLPPPPVDQSTTIHSLPRVIVMSPCAACKVLRRRCVEKCILAPYFPPTDPLRFITAHRVFGASNITKLLQELPESQRADAVSSMVYEANARIRNPVYGCAGAIYQLQNQVSELQIELAKTQAELLKMQCQQATSQPLICMDVPQSQHHYHHQHHEEPPSDNLGFSFYDSNFSPVWETF